MAILGGINEIVSNEENGCGLPRVASQLRAFKEATRVCNLKVSDSKAIRLYHNIRKPKQLENLCVRTLPSIPCIVG